MDVDNDSSFMATHEKPGQNYAKFYLHPVKNNVKSREAGRDIYEDRVYILILCPGQTKSEFRGPKRPDHERLYPQAWADFLAGNKEPQVVGTPIEYLPGITPARAKELRSVNVYTVEQMAECPDTAMRNVGMDFNSLKATAQTFISKATPEMDKLRQQVAELTAKLEALTAGKPEAPARRPGRPRKQPELQVAA